MEVQNPGRSLREAIPPGTTVTLILSFAGILTGAAALTLPARAEAQTDREIALRHAPVVHLHPRERFPPEDPLAFVARSEVMVHTGSTIKSAQGLTPEELAHFRSPFYRAPSTTRDRPGSSERLVWLDHSAGGKDTDGEDTGPRPAFYSVKEWGECTLVSYWFFYPHSRFLDSPFIAHDGDWEGLSLLLRDEEILSGWFRYHHFIEQVHRPDLLLEPLGDEDRLHVFAAAERHATYWRPGSHNPAQCPSFAKRFERCGRGLADLIKAAGGAILRDLTDRSANPWDTRQDLRPLDSQPWSEFIGSWGAPGGLRDETGPVGPIPGRRHPEADIMDRMLRIEARTGIRLITPLCGPEELDRA